MTLTGEIELEKVIILFDRGYPSLEMIYLLQEIGIKYIFRGKISNYRKEIEKMKREDEEIEIKITEKKKSKRKRSKRRIKKKRKNRNKISKIPNRNRRRRDINNKFRRRRIWKRRSREIVF